MQYICVITCVYETIIPSHIKDVSLRDFAARCIYICSAHAGTNGIQNELCVECLQCKVGCLQ